MTERLPFHFSLSCIGEGNGNPLQCSCLENPRGRGAWWAAAYGVAQSRTRLQRLSSRSSTSRPFTQEEIVMFPIKKKDDGGRGELGMFPEGEIAEYCETGKQNGLKTYH